MNKYAAESKAAREARARERSCESKVRFPTGAAALAANRGQETYHCRHCGGWHLTAKVEKALLLIRSRGRAILRR